MSETREKRKVENAKPENLTSEEHKTGKPKEKKATVIKKKEKAAYTRYRIDDKGLTRILPYCERCGSGYFMADHGNRFSCGHCGFTRYKQA